MDFTPVYVNLQSWRHPIKYPQLCGVLRELYVKSRNITHHRSGISYWARRFALKARLHGWTSTRANAPLPASLSGCSLKVSPQLHLHLNLVTHQSERYHSWASREFTRPTDPEREHQTRNIGFFFYAVMMAVRGGRRGGFWEVSLLPCLSVAPFTWTRCEFISIQFYL